MVRLIASIVFTASVVVGLSPPLVARQPDTESFLHRGEFARGESALLRFLDENPTDDQARFGLGVIQAIRAVENLGKALYEYGAVSENAKQPFLRLPVPKNDHPSAISYRALGRVLDAFANDLLRAEATLAGIRDDDVKLPLRLSQIRFDFAGNGTERTTLIEIITRLNGGGFEFQETNPEFLVQFDRGDVSWLRAYCHLLSAMVDAYRAVDEETGFERRVDRVFPRIEITGREEGEIRSGLKVVDPPRLRRARLHLVQVCELNRETWFHIRREDDDVHEWLPHPGQTDQLNLPITDQEIDGWLEGMANWEGALKGEVLLNDSLIRTFAGNLDMGMGINLKTLLDDPPVDLLNMERIQQKGIDPRYIEPVAKRGILGLSDLFQMFRSFQGPFDFARSIRMN